MSDKYRTGTPDIISVISDLRNRISKLERTPQLTNSAIDSGQIIVGGGASGVTIIASGANIPQHLIDYYGAFSRVVQQVLLFQSDIDNVNYIALISDTSGLPSLSFGVIKDGLTRPGFEVFREITTDQTTQWVGFFEAARVVFGNPLFGTSILHLNNGSIIYVNSTVRLNTAYDKASASANLTCTTSAQNITGALVTLSTNKSNAVAEVVASFDMEETVAGTTTIIGELVIDGGSAQADQARFKVASTNDLACISKSWNATIAAAGSHTFQLTGRVSASAGTQVINQTHTTVSVRIWEQ
jgi:hypothetical protein